MRSSSSTYRSSARSVTTWPPRRAEHHRRGAWCSQRGLRARVRRDVAPEEHQRRTRRRWTVRAAGTRRQHLGRRARRDRARPPSAAQLERLLGHEQAIAAAVDARYSRLGPALTPDAGFEADLLDQLRRLVVDTGPTHGSALEPLRDAAGRRCADHAPTRNAPRSSRRVLAAPARHQRPNLPRGSRRPAGAVRATVERAPEPGRLGHGKPGRGQPRPRAARSAAAVHARLKRRALQQLRAAAATTACERPVRGLKRDWLRICGWACTTSHPRTKTRPW